MASLSELSTTLATLSTKIDTLQASEGAQTAAITGLTGVVGALIDVVEELKASLSAEEQAVVDEAMTLAASTLAKVDAVMAGTSDQSADIHDLAERAAAAAAPPPPTP